MINLKKLAAELAKIALPIVAAAIVTHRSAKATAIDVARAEVLKHLA